MKKAVISKLSLLQGLRVLGIEVTEELSAMPKDALIEQLEALQKEKFGEPAVQCTICGADFPDIEACLYCGAQFQSEEDLNWYDIEGYQVAEGIVNDLEEAKKIVAAKTKKVLKEKFNIEGWTVEAAKEILGEQFEIIMNNKASRIAIKKGGQKCALLDNGTVLGYFYPKQEIEGVEVFTEEVRKGKHLGGICLASQKVKTLEEQLAIVNQMFEVAPAVVIKEKPVKEEKVKEKKKPMKAALDSDALNDVEDVKEEAAPVEEAPKKKKKK